jgi:alanine racemase
MHTNSIIEQIIPLIKKTSLFSEPLLEKNTNLMCCKGNAYGHGVTEIVSMAYKTDYPLLRFDVEESLTEVE